MKHCDNHPGITALQRSSLCFDQVAIGDLVLQQVARFFQQVDVHLVRARTAPSALKRVKPKAIVHAVLDGLAQRSSRV